MANLGGYPSPPWLYKVSPSMLSVRLWRMQAIGKLLETMQSAVGWVHMCWGERQREDGEKGKCSLALLVCSVTNLPMQFVASVVQDQKPVVGRGWWGSHMQGVGPGCQQRRRKNAWAGCGGNQGCSLTALTFGFDPQI